MQKCSDLGYFCFLNYSVKNKFYYCFGMDFTESSDYAQKIWANLGLFIGIFQFAICMIIANMRMFHWKILAYEGSQPTSISALNRILTNNFEHTFIFGCLLYAGIYHNPMSWPLTYFAHIVRVYIISRFLYSVGFFLGVNIGIPALRNLGFPGTIVAHTFLVFSFLGIDMFSKIAQLPLPEL